MIIPNDTLENWLVELKPYQKKSLEKLISEYGEEETVKRWLSSEGPTNVVHFCGNRTREPFFERFRDEFKKFICGDDSYKKEREKLAAEATVPKQIIISVISAALGAVLGYTATLLAPAVTVMLYSVGKVGLNAYCKSSQQVPQA
jgi:hypothetical protein